MFGYIDGFVFPILRKDLNEYRLVAEKIANIWKEYGALEYVEYVGDDMSLEGTRSFIDMVKAKDDETVVFGWVVFPSKEVRDSANKQVPHDSRMSELIISLINPQGEIFDAGRMVYGGFKPLVQSDG